MTLPAPRFPVLTVQVCPGTTEREPSVFVGADAHDALHWFFEVSPELARELAANLVKAAALAEQLRARPLPEVPVYAQ